MSSDFDVADHKRKREKTYLVLEVIEERFIFESDEIFTLVSFQNFVLLLLLCLGGILVQSREKFVAKDVVGISFLVVNLDVGEFGVNAEGEIGG